MKAAPLTDNKTEGTEFNASNSASLGLLSIFSREFIDGQSEISNMQPRMMPEPYRQLLAHSRDMTPTLEDFYDKRLGLRVLERFRLENGYYREILLILPDGKPVEYGVIKIHLEWFSESLQATILSECLPLGRILQDHALPHLSWPQSFFSVKPSTYLKDQLGINGSSIVYGRRNVLLNMEKRLLAEVVEILSPAESVKARNDLIDIPTPESTETNPGLCVPCMS